MLVALVAEPEASRVRCCGAFQAEGVAMFGDAALQARIAAEDASIAALEAELEALDQAE